MSLNRVLLWSQRRGSNDQFYYMREDVMYILERRKWDEITGIISDLNDISSIQLAGDIME